MNTKITVVMFVFVVLFAMTVAPVQATDYDRGFWDKVLGWVWQHGYDKGYEAGLEAHCEVCPTPEPCPVCDCSEELARMNWHVECQCSYTGDVEDFGWCLDECVDKRIEGAIEHGYIIGLEDCVCPTPEIDTYTCYAEGEFIHRGTCPCSEVYVIYDKGKATAGSDSCPICPTCPPYGDAQEIYIDGFDSCWELYEVTNTYFNGWLLNDVDFTTGKCGNALNTWYIDACKYQPEYKNAIDDIYNELKA